MSDRKPYYTLHGFTISPFSMKMRTYLRYRRIPFIWAPGERANEVAQTKVETKDLLDGLLKETSCYDYLAVAV